MSAPPGTVAADGEADDGESETAASADAEASGVASLLGDRRRRLVLAAGALGTLAGVVAVATGVVGDVASQWLAVAGIATASVGAWLGYDRYRSPDFDRRPPAVERRSHVRRAGAAFEAAVRATASDNEGTAMSAWNEVVERLRPVAIDAVADRDGLDDEAAREAVERGTWLGDDAATPAGRVRSWFDPGELELRPGYLRRSARFEGRVRRAVRALAAHVLGEDPDPQWGPAEPVDGAAEWEPGLRRTGRWRGVAGLGLAALGLAAVAESAGPALVAAVLFGVAGYARLLDPPTPRLAVERDVPAADPEPGEAVTVSVTVENAGGATLPDLRVVDGVPDGLAVVDGSPRRATALRPGERTTLTYDVRAVYGEHEFRRLHAAVRDPSGQRERAVAVETEPATLSCAPRMVHASVPLHPQATGTTGRVTSDVGGSGTEFHSVRAYRRGDPLGRVDWNRLARTGDLATLRFREEHAATVVVLIDARSAAFRAPDEDALSAVDRSFAGAAQVIGSLLADGDRVALATVGPNATWVRPGAGDAHRDLLRATLAGDVTARLEATDDEFNRARYVRRLRRRLPADAQLLCFTPLLDDDVVDLVRRLAAHGHDVTAFSPDPTATDTVGGTVSRIERVRRLAVLRASGVRVADWPHDQPLAVAVERAKARWRA